MINNRDNNPRILSVATVAPPHRVEQREIKEFAPISSLGSSGTWTGSYRSSTTVR